MESWDMWDLYNKNFEVRGLNYNEVNHDIVKKYSEKDLEKKELQPLSNWGLVRLCDRFLTFRHGNIFHGSSQKILKNLKSDAESAYPLIHEAVYGLFCDFLDCKVTHGTTKEQEIYSGMTVCGLVDRLLTKRCVSYYGRNENYFLLTGEKGQGDFSTIGTDKEVPPLIMENCLTRDEIKLSSLLMISSKETRTVKDFTYNAVVIGIPSPCLNREGLFEWQDLMITRRQNTAENGYGPDNKDSPKDQETLAKRRLRSVWNSFYGGRTVDFSSINKKKKMGWRSETLVLKKLSNSSFMDNTRLIMRRSLATTLLLNEANTRAKEEDKWAYIVVDKNKLGLGNCLPIHEEMFLRNFCYEILCGAQHLRNTYKIHFVGFNEIETMKDGWKLFLGCGVYGNLHPREGIEIKYSTKEEFNLKEIFDIKEVEILLVESYQLDANALPGNELWVDKVAKDYSHPSFDVRHSSIPFIHNAHINGSRLCGSNLRTYTHYGVGHWTTTHAVLY